MTAITIDAKANAAARRASAKKVPHLKTKGARRWLTNSEAAAQARSFLQWLETIGQGWSAEASVARVKGRWSPIFETFSGSLLSRLDHWAVERSLTNAIATRAFSQMLDAGKAGSYAALTINFAQKATRVSYWAALKNWEKQTGIGLYACQHQDTLGGHWHVVILSRQTAAAKV